MISTALYRTPTAPYQIETIIFITRWNKVLGNGVLYYPLYIWQE